MSEPNHTLLEAASELRQQQEEGIEDEDFVTINNDTTSSSSDQINISSSSGNEVDQEDDNSDLQAVSLSNNNNNEEALQNITLSDDVDNNSQETLITTTATAVIITTTDEATTTNQSSEVIETTQEPTKQQEVEVVITESTTSTTTSTNTNNTTTNIPTINVLGGGGDQSPSLQSNITYQERLHYYKEALKPSTIDLSVIQHLADQGIPESQGLRSIYWKIILGYLPSEKGSWKSDVERSRKIYQDWVMELMINPWKEQEEKKIHRDDHPLSVSVDSKWNEYFQDQNILVDIEKDVRRTFPSLHFFNHQQEEGKTIHYEALRRILFIYAKLNPGIKYVQGMNEILGPIYYIFATDPDADCKEGAEADSFFCFTNIMSEIRDNFCKTLDKSDVGVISSIKKLNFLLRKKDRQLWNDLETKQIHPQFYSFRWITLLLSQEFELPDVLRLWDSLFSDPNRFEFLYYFCCAMLICVRNQILESSFADSLKLLQSYPQNIEFHTIYSTALSLRDGTFKLNTEDVFKSGQSYLQMFNPFAKVNNNPSSPIGSYSPTYSSPIITSVSPTNNNNNTFNNNNNSSNNLSAQQQQQQNNTSPIADSLKSWLYKFGGSFNK
ncbi:TBC1 domain family member 13 protein [Cavenderia fasciculata]|uniref:TBC1 domain family member 13 n=1 Tax=Cavenderia fasciculata TaxID=261658 RepID=F4PL46_CACFS|nr:TBC1 domain family member 13 protein [Cavenderia fasciculata]EGG23268.1 TBC1 domain family member 13 protein [Cavenderia fasciculata]|eukprot:XP_004361119.1 TBC1 domain family member 13 protein [Cavenderia fasciculata]